MLTAISSPTTHSFYFNILKDYLSLLLVSNIATFLIIKADSFSVSAVCQLQLFEANTHIFTGFSPPSQTSKLSKWGGPCTALELGMLGPGEAGSKGKWKGDAIHEGKGLKTEKQLWIQWQDTSHWLLCPVKHTRTKAQTQGFPAGPW